MDNVNYIADVPEVVFIVWFGKDISDTRLNALKTLINNIKIPYILITEDNYMDFNLITSPIHPSFQYLSGNHKSDYLRAYILHHYGGMYHDIKYRYKSVKGSFIAFSNPDIWIKTRAERYEHWIGYDIDNPDTKWIQKKYAELGT